EPTQLDEYTAALKVAAKEFEDQSVEFERVAVSIREAIAKATAQRNERVIPPPRMGDWKWPSILESDPSVKLVAEAAHSGNFLGAHALLDFFRSTKIKSDEDYFRARAGLIFLSSNSEARRVYLLSELEANKQDSLIKEWRSLGALNAENPMPEIKE
ncbi:MAG: hypothetical protein NDJ90_16185, partial [Oligoflexia bacterium]|nr:hypothetical protein [Oligoflexia bacterium]